MSVRITGWWRMLLAVTVIASASSCLAAETLTTPRPAIDSATERWQTFQECHYDAYLPMLGQELRALRVSELPLNLGKMVAFAITLDKTHRQNGAEAQAVRTYLAASPDALRYFRATQQLISGDTTAVEVYFAGAPPNFEVWEVQAAVLHEHGYPIAANIFDAVAMTGSDGGPVGDSDATMHRRLQAWLNIPANVRQPVDRLILDRVKGDWYVRGRIARGVLRSLGDPLDDTTRQSRFDMAAQVGGDSVFTLSIAEELAKGAARTYGLKVAERVAQAAPQDSDEQVAVGKFIIQYGSPEQVETFYRRLLETTVCPTQRLARLDYIEYQIARKEQPSAGLKGESLALSQADALLLSGNTNAASQLYGVLLHQMNLSAGARIDAFAGLLATAPAKAVEDSPMLDLHKTKPGDIGWAAYQLSLAVDTAYDRYRSSTVMTATQAANPTPDLLRSVPWLPTAAILIQRFIDAAPAECLEGAPRDRNRAIRIPAVILCKVVGQPAQARAILNRVVTYEVPPPPGGWHGPFGLPIGDDANKPRTVTSPIDNETQAWLVDINDTLTGLGIAKMEAGE